MNFKNMMLTWLTLLAFLQVKWQEIQESTRADLSDSLSQTELSYQDSLAQEEEQTINPFTIKKAYAGQLTATRMAADDIDDTGVYSSTRAWWIASFDITKGTSLNMLTALTVERWSDLELQASPLRFTSVSQKLGDKMSISAWKQPVPATALRPNPISGLWHFETSTDALIAWGWMGVNLHKKGTFNWSLGIADRWENLEYGAKIGYAPSEEKNINLAGWYQNKDILGAVMIATYDNVSGAIVYNNNPDSEALGYKLSYAVDLTGKDATLILYGVQNRDLNLEEDKAMNTEFGALVAGSTKLGDTPIDITMWSAYDVVNKNINGYLQLAFELK